MPLKLTIIQTHYPQVIIVIELNIINFQSHICSNTDLNDGFNLTNNNRLQILIILLEHITVFWCWNIKFVCHLKVFIFLFKFFWFLYIWNLFRIHCICSFYRAGLFFLVTSFQNLIGVFMFWCINIHKVVMFFFLFDYITIGLLYGFYRWLIKIV